MTEEKNMLADAEFKLNLGGKEVTLKPYSFAVQIDLMESGLINEFMTVNKELVDKHKLNPSKSIEEIAKEMSDTFNFQRYGKMLRTAGKIMYKMLPREQYISMTEETLLEKIAQKDTERFLTWISAQFSRSANFLTEAPKEGAVPEQKPE